MLRLALWFVILFMIVKIARLFMNWKQYTGSEEESADKNRIVIPPFDNVQDADFEDITPKPPAEDPQHPQS
jgi:hypothetical protein